MNNYDDLGAEQARLETIVLAQQERLKQLEVKLDRLREAFLVRGRINAKLNRELQKLRSLRPNGQ